MAGPVCATLSFEVSRHTRKREVRPRTEDPRRYRLRIVDADHDLNHPRPQTRADCEHAQRPCPYVGCRYNLYLDVSEKSGNIKFNFPDVDPTEMTVSCALDDAKKGGMTIEEVGARLNVTRERSRQIESQALAKLVEEPEIVELR